MYKTYIKLQKKKTHTHWPSLFIVCKEKEQQKNV